MSELTTSVQELGIQLATYAERVDNLVNSVNRIRDDLVWTRRFALVTLIGVVVNVFLSVNGNGG